MKWVTVKSFCVRAGQEEFRTAFSLAIQSSKIQSAQRKDS